MAEQPPRSTAAPPPPSGNGALIGAGIVLLLGAAGGILYWVTKKDAQPLPPKTETVASASSTAGPAPTMDLPAIELPKDAGPDDAGTDAGPKVVATGGGAGGCACGAAGQISDAIKAAAGSKGGTAKTCYKTALEGNEGLAGTIELQVKIGPSGETCGVTVLSDSVGSMKLQQCVKSRMYGSYPAPKGGCVEVKVPVVFKPKT